MNKHTKYMKEALREAEKAKVAGEVPVGAIIVCDDIIIARAHNLTETLNDPTAHAEMQAITIATNTYGGKYLTKAVIYVTLEPCPMCAAAINWAQIKGVIYGASDPKRGYTLFSPGLLHPKCKELGGVLEEECSKLVTDFFKRVRNDTIRNNKQ